VVLASGSGTNLQALLDACADPSYGATVVAVGSDRSDATALSRAAEAGIPTFICVVKDFADRDDWDADLTSRVSEYAPDLVVSAGFLKLVGRRFLARFGGRYLNTHNALLPAFPGIHGPRDALAYGVKVSGATLFIVDAGVDSGPIVAQAAVAVRDDDTEQTLTERIKVVERRQLVEYLGRMVREGWTVTGRKVTIGVSEQPTSHVEGESERPRPVTRALVSVFDKDGLPELIAALGAAGVEIVSTGNTAALVESLGFPVTRVEELTGFPECLDGRVKTLHPAVHAGLLADRRRPDHVRQLAELGIAGFDLLVSNLYPFQQVVASGADLSECIEMIDIGGPAMVRAAAKNHATVAVVTDPALYPFVTQSLLRHGSTLEVRRALAARAFADIAEYDAAVARWCAEVLAPEGLASALAAASDGSAPVPGSPTDRAWPELGAWVVRKSADLRYGENPHQRAALYTDASSAPGLAQARQLGGKEMSYNNYVDADAAWRACHDFSQPAVAIIKHANPCGIAVGDDIVTAYRKAHASDPVSAYGAVIAVNRPVTPELAHAVTEVFTEVIVAPAVDAEAAAILGAKKGLRILVAPPYLPGTTEMRPITGGLLMQTPDRLDAPGDDPATWRLVAGAAATESVLADLGFAWRAVRSVRSNAILLAAGGASVGVGMGQVNRVDSARLAVARAGDRVRGSVAASDAYFPFADGLEVLLEAGVAAVVQPGGSKRDGEVIAAAETAGLTMYLTGTRHFYH
jgi:phosphoribosylaminoimidazolecarboxamide formyltransferase/IMP cyclohydrolase